MQQNERGLHFSSAACIHQSCRLVTPPSLPGLKGGRKKEISHSRLFADQVAFPGCSVCFLDFKSLRELHCSSDALWISSPVELMGSVAFYWGLTTFFPLLAPGRGQLLLNVQLLTVYETHDRSYMVSSLMDGIKRGIKLIPLLLRIQLLECLL